MRPHRTSVSEAYPATSEEGRCHINFSREQWLVAIGFAVSNICNGMCFSLQAPFYPREAERKGCNATRMSEQELKELCVMRTFI